MNTSTSIVVGVDGSGASLDAVRWAARDAELRGTTLDLVSAYQDHNVYTTLAAMPARVGTEPRRTAIEILDTARTVAAIATGRSTAAIAVHAVNGPTIPVLVEYARSARMLVVGSRGNGEYFAELLGSVSAGVSVAADCAVTVIRNMPAAGCWEGPVIVCLDGSTRDESAMAVGFEEASLRGIDLIAVRTTSDERPAGSDVKDIASAERTSRWQDLYPNVNVDRITLPTNIIEPIVTLSATAQAVVVGSRGRGGFGGLLQKSTSRSLSHLVDCPLIVVHERAD